MHVWHKAKQKVSVLFCDLTTQSLHPPSWSSHRASCTPVARGPWSAPRTRSPPRLPETHRHVRDERSNETVTEAPWLVRSHFTRVLRFFTQTPESGFCEAVSESGRQLLVWTFTKHETADQWWHHFRCFFLTVSHIEDIIVTPPTARPWQRTLCEATILTSLVVLFHSVMFQTFEERLVLLDEESEELF